MPKYNSHCAEAVREQLERLLKSSAFVHSGRRRRFLSYIVEAALQGRCNEISEYAIGFEVFDKDDSFDPRLDSVVRVYATLVRKDLRAYYETEGLSDRVMIQVPTGTYAPVFVLSGKESNARESNDSSRSFAPFSPTIAVTPLAPSATDEYAFCLGVVEETINALVDVGGLRVLASSYAFNLDWKRQQTARTSELGITTILELTARRHKTKTRVIARMFDAQSGHVKWKIHFDAIVDEIFTAQEELAKRIANAFSAYLTDRVVVPQSQSSK